MHKEFYDPNHVSPGSRELMVWPNYHRVAALALGMSWDKARPIIHRLADGLRATGFDDEQPTHPKRIFWQGEAGGMHPDDIPKLKSRYEESLSANA